MRCSHRSCQQTLPTWAAHLLSAPSHPTWPANGIFISLNQINNWIFIQLNSPTALPVNNSWYAGGGVFGSAANRLIVEVVQSRRRSWLKAPTSAFTFKTLLRHYAKRALTPRSLNVKLGQRHNYHKGRAAIRHYANQPACPFWPNFTLRDRGVNACLA